VPGTGNPAAYDRYAYVLNDPIMMNDPSGHGPCYDTSDYCKNYYWNDYNRFALKQASSYLGGSPTHGNNNNSNPILADIASTRLHPAPVNYQTKYDEESFNDSGNQLLDKLIGIAPPSGSSAMDAVLVFVPAITF